MDRIFRVKAILFHTMKYVVINKDFVLYLGRIQGISMNVPMFNVNVCLSRLWCKYFPISDREDFDRINHAFVFFCRKYLLLDVL